MGRGRASALKVYAHAYKCLKINLFKYSRVIHQKKRLKSLMNKQKTVLQNFKKRIFARSSVVPGASFDV